MRTVCARRIVATRRGPMPSVSTAASPPPRRWPMACSSMPPTARTYIPRRASPASPAPRLRGQHQRQVAAPPENRARAVARRARRPPTTPISCPMARPASSPSSWKPNRSSPPPRAGRRCQDPGSSRSAVWPGRGGDGSTRVEVSTDGGQSWTAATLQEPVLPIAWTRFRLPVAVGRPTDPAAEPGHRRDRLRAADHRPTGRGTRASTPSFTTTPSRPGPSRPMGR